MKKQYTVGDVLYFYPEEMVLMVTMASDEGVRYIHPLEPETDDKGDVVSRYASNETLSEGIIPLGNIRNISAMLSDKLGVDWFRNKNTPYNEGRVDING